MHEKLAEVHSLIDSFRDDVIEIQRALTAIPALAPESGGEGEWKKALKAKEFMDQIGYDEFEEINTPCNAVPDKFRPNHIYRIKGEDSSRTIWLMSHLDIVPPGELKLWNTNPYEIKVDGDVIYGRGVEDNQQGIVSSMLMVKALRQLGIKPRYDVALLFISDEETGNTDGIQHILKTKPDIFGKDDFVYVPDSGSEDGSQVEVAEKSILWIKFTTIGKQTHASRPDGGINAFKAASNLAVRLQVLYDIFGEKNDLFEPSVSTFEPTKKEANVPNVNSIPGEDVFYMDCRVLPLYNLDDVIREIRGICDGAEADFNVKINMEYVQKQQAAPETDPEAPVVAVIKEAVSSVYKVDAKPCGIGGGTVAAYVRKAGIPAVVWARLTGTAHEANETSLISSVLGDAKVFAYVALK